jgi:hypothetical protein
MMVKFLLRSSSVPLVRASLAREAGSEGDGVAVLAGGDLPTQRPVAASPRVEVVRDHQRAGQVPVLQHFQSRPVTASPPALPIFLGTQRVVEGACREW